ncbi:MAG: hypothetical protein HYV27_12135 [Candidatus Hydrogenedentes bacterium]|nr:hypothetical protein [Candidatus Hydrogenedentota bacterium]
MIHYGKRATMGRLRSAGLGALLAAIGAGCIVEPDLNRIAAVLLGEFDALDIDRDNTLSFFETQGASIEVSQTSFTALDDDHNGGLTRQELGMGGEGEGEGNPLELSFAREITALDGGFQVTIRMDAPASAPSALGMMESLPEGWAISGVMAIDGAAPDLAPSVGATGTVEFVWVQPVVFPYRFAYTVQADTGAGQEGLSGQLEYRTDRDERYFSSAVTENDDA